MIERLRREIQKLKDELALSTGEQRTGELSPDETDRYAVRRRRALILPRDHPISVNDGEGAKYVPKFMLVVTVWFGVGVTSVMKAEPTTGP